MFTLSRTKRASPGRAVFIYHPILGSPAPCYYPAKKGIEFLADHFDDETYLVTPTQQPSANNLLHWLAISETHMIVEQAVQAQDTVRLLGWHNEFDVVNKDETKPEKRFHIYQLLEETPKRLVAAPDAAMLLGVRGYQKVFLWEQDRATTGVAQTAARKAKGYAVMAERQLHRRIFPETNVNTFSVLMVVPTESRRKSLQKAFRQKPGHQLWRFVSQSDLTSATCLHESIWYPCEGDPNPLIKSDTDSKSTEPA